MSRAFKDDKAFLSNFYMHLLQYKGEVYLSAEHAYQSEKCALDVERTKVKAQATPWYAKRLGRIVLAKVGWDGMKLAVMEDIVRAKFRDDFLAAKLRGTGTETLVEVNDWHDLFWGVCDGECKRPGSHPMGRPLGENNLGKILMKVRAEKVAQLQSGYAHCLCGGVGCNSCCPRT